MKSLIRRLTTAIHRTLFRPAAVNHRGRGLINLIDVGSVGELPAPWNRNAYRIQHLLKFEPRDQAATQANITSMDVALWESAGERPFYVYQGRGGSGSSLFKQDFEYVRTHFDELRTRGPKDLAETWLERSQLDHVETIACQRLDDVLAELQQPFEYHFLKIDAQGAEYPILRGAENLLRTGCIGLHLELFVVPLYQDIVLLPDVEAYLHGLGFAMVKRFPAHGSFDSQHDCVFLKQNAHGRIASLIRQVYSL
ncbi:MAG: FkbM family methyltransferase [Anaerolineae bacterium]|nr:FkbM family methyltransferase [Anaerolineae bacterium]